MDFGVLAGFKISKQKMMMLTKNTNAQKQKELMGKWF